MNNFKQYRRKSISEMRQIVFGEDLKIYQYPMLIKN